MLPYEDFASLPLLYHLNSEPWLNIEAYNDPAAEVRFKDMSDGGFVALPHADGDSPLRKLLRTRRSCRDYEARSMPLQILASLLESTYGCIGAAPFADGHEGLRRPVPSAGGLYPLEFYVATTAVDGLADGIHHYHALHHRLEGVSSHGRPDLRQHFLEQYYLENANVIVFITAVFERCLRKYGSRGYRYVLLEAGHAAQTLCLVAAECNLATLCVGGFRDALLNRWIGLDGRTEAVLYCIAVGYAATGPS